MILFKLWMFTFMTQFEELMKYADEKAFNPPFLLCSLISSPKVPPHKEIFKNSEVCPITRKYSYQMQ